MRWDLLYAAAAVPAAPVLLWRGATDRRWRDGWGERLGGVPVPPDGSPRVWFHAASVGELNALGALIAAYREAYPDGIAFVTAFSKTGRELAVRRYGADRAGYMPADLTPCLRRAFGRIRPDVLVLSELELWPNLVRIATGRRIPVLCLSARLSERAFPRYRRFRPLLGGTFRRVTAFGTQDEEVAERLRGMGVDPERITVTGSLKYEGALAAVESDPPDDLQGWLEAGPYWVAASTREGEEGEVLAAHRSAAVGTLGLRCVLAPRHPERFDEVAGILAADGVRFHRRSAGPIPEGTEILLLDSIGELASFYRLARVVFVGGTLAPIGGHNVLEPAAAGVPVLFGPYTRTVRAEAEALLAAGAARRVEDADGLGAALAELLEDGTESAVTGVSARRLVTSHRGALGRSMEILETFLPTRNTG